MKTRFDEAMSRIATGTLNGLEAMGVAGELSAAGFDSLATELYGAWIAANQGDPLLPYLAFNHGVSLSGEGRLPEACAAYASAITANPDFHQAHINLATTLDRLGQPKLAIAQLQLLLGRLAQVTADNVGWKALAYKQLGRLLTNEEQFTQAEAALLESLRLDDRQHVVGGNIGNLRMRQCKWPVIQEAPGVSREAQLRWMAPLSVAQCLDDPLFQLSAGNRTARTVAGAAPAPHVVGPWLHTGEKERPVLKIGYLSSDLRSHAIGSLMSEVFGLHDRSKVEVFAYYCGIPGTDIFQEHIRGSVDHWLDVTPLDDRACAARILDDGIDILVDINGHTAGDRLSMLALRPAPVIVNWLGYPGSMGSSFHNYIIADGAIIPEEHEPFYSEKVLRLPCYQPNDRRRKVVEDLEPRSAHGLPEDAFVFACLNGNNKISNLVFDEWLAILREVPKGVLWLLEDSPEACVNLRAHAARQGVAGERIIFAPRLGPHQHLMRLRLIDLFLDSYPYGAHTTASDALWMGVPILTLSGLSFASRVCGSLVRAAGVEELVTASPAEYRARAIEFGLHPERLAPLRQRIVANRPTCVLFDMELLVRSLEGLFAVMWEDYVSGRQPQPVVGHLSAYGEAAAHLSRDQQVFRSLADYLDLYRRQLACDDRYRLRHSATPWLGD